MRSEVTAENKVTIVIVFGTTHRMGAKSHHVIRNMDGTVRKLDWKAMMMLTYYCDKQLPKIAKVKVKKIMELNIYRKLTCAK